MFDNPNPNPNPDMPRVPRPYTSLVTTFGLVAAEDPLQKLGAFYKIASHQYLWSS